MIRFSNDKKGKRKSLLLWFNFCFIIFTFIGISIILLIVCTAWKMSIRNTTSRLQANIYQTISDNFDSLINNSLSITDSKQNLIKNRTVDMYNEADREHFFSGILSYSIYELYDMSYVTEQGDYYGALKKRDNKIAYLNYSYSPDTAKNDRGLNSDPRTFDWYQQAKVTGKQILLLNYDNFTNDNMVITSAYPVYDDKGSLIGVLASHTHLNSLSSSLRNILWGKLGSCYIVNKKTGEVIAGSNGTITLHHTLPDGTVSGMMMGESKDPVAIHAYIDYLLYSKGTNYIRKGNTGYHIKINEYKNRGIDLIFISCLPNTIYTPIYNHYLYPAMYLSVTATLISIALIIISSRIILKPIRNLVQTAEKLSEGVLSIRATVYRNDDIGNLARTFNHMAEELNSYINTLEDKINERTSELAGANQALIIAKDQAIAANEMKSQFLANISHEIRTPMNGIYGFLQLLEETPLNEDQKDYVKTISVSTSSLIAIINDLLDISKIEAGRMTLERIPFELIPTIQEVIHLFQPKVASKKLSLYYNYDTRLPNYVIGDPVKLKQIIGNLISNAVKFTEKGCVTIDAALEAETDEALNISISVTDTGIGLATEEIDRLFLPFSQADATTTRKFGGTGLGLAICKSLTEMMGGSISVTSIPGKGSTFRFNVLLQKAPADSYPQDNEQAQALPYKPLDHCVAPPSLPAPLSQPTVSILLAEDNEINSKLFVKLLNAKGLECDVVSTGEGVLSAYHRKHYDIIFMDCQMPAMNGYETTRKIRENEMSKEHTVIIALTAYASKEDQKKCVEAGMDEYISKPIETKQLYQIINKYANTVGADPVTADSQYEEAMNALANETGIDRDSCAEIMDIFYDQSLPLLQEIKALLNQNQASQAGVLLHKLKGSALTIRAGHISGLALKAEELIKSGEIVAAHEPLGQLELLLNRTK